MTHTIEGIFKVLLVVVSLTASGFSQAYDRIMPWQTYGEGNVSQDNNWNYVLGYHFTPKVNGIIHQLGGNFNGSKQVVLFDKSDGVKLAEVTIDSSNDWQYVDIAAVSVKAGHTYTAAVYMAGSGGSSQIVSTGFFPKTYEFVRIEGGTYAYTGTNPNARPENQHTSAIFGMVDIAFAPDTVTPAAVTYQQVWQEASSNDVPIFKNNSWDYAMGYHFTPTMDGRITQLGGLFNGEKMVRVFNRDTGEVVVESLVSAQNEWAYQQITPVNIQAGQNYTIAVYLAGTGGSLQYLDRYALQSQTGNINIESATYISTSNDPDARPINMVSSYMYGTPDFVFERDEAAWEWVCKEQFWEHGPTGKLYQTGLGLFEGEAFTNYAVLRNKEGKVDYPRCSYMKGNIRIPVLLVDWEDFEPRTDLSNDNNPNSIATNYIGFTPTEISNHINGEGSLSAYFNDITAGRVSMQFDVFGWLESSAPNSYLDTRASYKTQLSCDRKEIFRDAMRDAIVSHDLDMTDYDADGNNIVDAAVLVYEGHAGQCSGTNMTWLSSSSAPSFTPPKMFFENISEMVDINDPNKPMFANQDILVQYFNNISETSYLGGEQNRLYTWVHELGHTMLGYIDTYASKYNVKRWGVSGNFTELTHPAAWEKWLYGRWLDAGVINESGTYKLYSNDIPDGTEYDRGAYLYAIPIDGSTERFLVVENRWFDAEGNTYTRWAPYNSRESGLAIFELDLTATKFDTDKIPVYRHAPDRPSYEGFNLTELNAYRSEDTFSQCYDSQCITIDKISAPGNQVSFSVTMTPVEK